MTKINNEFANDIDWFLNEVGSRKNMLPTFAHAAELLTKNIDKQLDKIIEHHAYEKTYDEESGNLISYAIPEEYNSRHRVLAKSCHHAIIFADLLPKMTLVSLVSLFDAYLARLIRNMLKLRPEILNGSDKPLTYAQIVNFESVEAVREYMINSEKTQFSEKAILIILNG